MCPGKYLQCIAACGQVQAFGRSSIFFIYCPILLLGLWRSGKVKMLFCSNAGAAVVYCITCGQVCAQLSCVHACSNFACCYAQEVHTFRTAFRQDMHILFHNGCTLQVDHNEDAAMKEYCESLVPLDVLFRHAEAFTYETAEEVACANPACGNSFPQGKGHYVVGLHVRVCSTQCYEELLVRRF